MITEETNFNIPEKDREKLNKIYESLVHDWVNLSKEQIRDMVCRAWYLGDSHGGNGNGVKHKKRNIVEVLLRDEHIKVEIADHHLTYKEAWEVYGQGTWIYCKERHALERVSIGSHSDIPYSESEFMAKFIGNHHCSRTYYKVLSSSHPLWLWWGKGCLNLDWEKDKSLIALPRLKE